MANGDVQVLDLPNNNLNDLNNLSHTDPKSTSGGVESTEEFRVMMAYAQRRRPKTTVGASKPGSPETPTGGLDSNGTTSPQTPAKTEKETPEKKKGGKKKRLKLRKWLSCIKPRTMDEDERQNSPETPNDPYNRCWVSTPDVEVEDKFDEIAIRLTEIADDIPFTPPELESDAPDDEVEKLIGLLLRETGDRLNERELKNFSITAELFKEYSFFERLITTLLARMGLGASDPDTPGPQTSTKTQIAVTCEVTSRLSAVDTLPMNRLLGYGATYLQNHYSSWAKQQGGYEAAFEGDKESDEEEVQ